MSGQSDPNPNTQIVELLSNILRWTKIGALNLREALPRELATEQQRLVYELSDGERSSRDVSALSGVSYGTVAAWWRRWRELGFVDDSPKYSNRAQRLCSLRMLGIQVTDTLAEPNSNGGEKRTRRPKKGAKTDPVENDHQLGMDVSSDDSM